MATILQISSVGVKARGEGTPYKGPKGVPGFLRLQVYEKVGILLVEVHEIIGKSVIWVCERAQRANRWILWLCKAEKSSFVINSYFNDSAFTAVKRDGKFLTMYVKGGPFVNRRDTKGVPFS